MKIGWVLGWAVPETWFAPLARAAVPAAEHVMVTPTADAVTRLEARGPFDWVVGYSLGTHLLLHDHARVSRLGKVALLAPIFAFPREAELGGRIAKTQVRQLARWVRREPSAALADFYQRAGLDIFAETAAMQPVAELSWGLERLENGHVAPPLPAGWRAWCGVNDALLDVDRLQAVAPGIERVAAGTHHPEALLRAWSTEAVR